MVTSHANPPLGLLHAVATNTLQLLSTCTTEYNPVHQRALTWVMSAWTCELFLQARLFGKVIYYVVFCVMFFSDFHPHFCQRTRKDSSHKPECQTLGPSTTARVLSLCVQPLSLGQFECSMWGRKEDKQSHQGLQQNFTFSWTSVSQDVIIHSWIPASIHELSITLFLHTCTDSNSSSTGTRRWTRSFSEATFMYHRSVEVDRWWKSHGNHLNIICQNSYVMLEAWWQWLLGWTLEIHSLTVSS